MAVVVGPVEDGQGRHVLAGLAFQREVGSGLGGAGDAADTDKTVVGGLHPDAVAGLQEVKGLAIPAGAAGADEAITDSLVPGAARGRSEGGIELAVPGFGRLPGAGGRFEWRLGGAVAEPGAAEQLLAVLGEDGEAEDVDGDAAVGKVSDDALGIGVEFGGDDDDLMGLVQRLLVEVGAEAGAEGVG